MHFAECIIFLDSLIGGLQAISRFSQEHKTKGNLIFNIRLRINMNFEIWKIDTILNIIISYAIFCLLIKNVI
jgi:hypothetical protein